MGYEDRDYFRPKPKFELSSAVSRGTLALIIVVAAGYISGLVIADTLSFAGSFASQGVRDFWAAAATEGRQAWWARQIFVLTASDIALWQQGAQFGGWKVLTSWMVAPGLISAVLDAIFIYFAGKALEEPLGTRRFLLLFVGACVVGNLLAAPADALLQFSRTQVVIMGCGPGIVACFTGLLWILPDQRSLGGWPLRRVIGVVIGVLLAINVAVALFSPGEIGLSATHLIWGAAFGALFMQVLRNAGKLPKVAAAASNEPWSNPGYLNSYSDEDPRAARLRERERKEAAKREAEEAKRRAAQAAEQAQLDAILEKISRTGITSLTRAEKKFLDDQSKRKKGGNSG
ncbi:MAG: rhomboid family intramembrane serine protease [Planctomycetes bacterium]|nr:rhomboid family intramembrane serine protease [Planctomycetota bacterium]MCW8135007.1 rhomboid family intramembrane serine protease [Planctomycetota bacterium]